MNIELFKSILLTLLVILSGLLTWNIWSYQPPLDPIDNPPSTVDISIADERTNRELIRPGRFLVHSDETIRGTSSLNELNELVALMEQWTLFNLRENTSLNEEEFEEVVHGSNRLEIIFPAQVPFTTYQDVLNFEVSQLPDATFDRVVVKMPEEENATFTVYFVSYDAKQVFEAKVDEEDFDPVNEAIIAEADEEYPVYFEYRAGNRVHYLPQASSEVLQYNHVMDELREVQFRNALFQDVNDVDLNSISSNKKQYFDQTSLMEVDEGVNIFNYVNPSVSRSAVPASPADLLQRSQRFVNEHKGWTDTYYLYNLDVASHRVSYRMHVQGLPVFNDKGQSNIAQIDLQWGENRIYKYDRSLMQQLQGPSTTQTASVASGYNVIEAIEDREDYDPALLQDVLVGYFMSIEPREEDLYTLEPMWFYLYDGSWQRVPLDGGDPVGLE
ncbi:YycH family regulatory protein [Jeotgalibacillus proteolyticus]|uniref:YycH family regulatory protein n=1 Tax=Jeotgalibacillus proteolyticus TaxID=2082395 RepID=UPI003CEE398A